MVALGWAVIDINGINVRTVSPTRIAAIIDWLVVEQDQLVTKYTEDSHIEMLWGAYHTNERVVKVTIKEVSHG